MYSCIREDTVALEYALLSIDGKLMATRNNGRTTVLVSSFFSTGYFNICMYSILEDKAA